MGSGKTTIGRGLARRLNREFFDSDREVEARCGVNIPTIFEYEGEEGFRNRETQALEHLCAQTDIVLATGGGAILRRENRQLLRRSGFVIYLTVSLDEQLERTCRDRNRPLLQTADPRATLAALRQQRAPLYEAVANVTISTDQYSVNAAVHKIHKLLKQKKSAHFHANTGH